MVVLKTVGNYQITFLLIKNKMQNLFHETYNAMIPEPQQINLFVLNDPFLYPLKTSENRKVFYCFQGVEKGCIGNEWVKEIFARM